MTHSLDFYRKVMIMVINVETIVNKKIKEAVPVFPGSGTIRNLIKNSETLTNIDISILYSFLRFSMEMNVTDTEEYKSVYEIVYNHEKRKMKGDNIL